MLSWSIIISPCQITSPYSSAMAFDFERYLQSCDSPNAEFYKNHGCASSPSNITDGIPGATELSTPSKETDDSNPPRRLKPQNGEHLLPIDRLLGKTPSQGNTDGVDCLESRFRSNQNLSGKRPGRGVKTGLFKQTSLPASLSGHGGSRTKPENSGRRRRNSVRFADEVGENLTTFLMIPSRFEDLERDRDASAKATGSASTSTSDKRDISAKHDQKLSTTVSTNAKTDPTVGKRETPSFQLCFDQPASNFEDFRRRLHFQFICLENVKVDVKTHADGTTSNGFVNHGTVLCTIKVRNIHPMKRVFARCTDNNWRTYADIFAVYVSDGTLGFNEYDTFTFALQNPLRYQGNLTSNDDDVDVCVYCRKTASVEFALCYEVLGSTYWDNNNGCNYRIVWM